MNKRIVIWLLTAVSLAEAQQPAKVPRIGVLSPGSVSSAAPNRDAFRQGLRDLGYVDGQNITIEYRYAEGKTDRLTALAAKLVRLKVDVMVTGGMTSTHAAKRATSTIPPNVLARADKVIK